MFTLTHVRSNIYSNNGQRGFFSNSEISLRSNLGQMGFELKPAMLKAFADLNIRFEVHILSYGEVENS
jgi:hypothetical protein